MLSCQARVGQGLTIWEEALKHAAACGVMGCTKEAVRTKMLYRHWDWHSTGPSSTGLRNWKPRLVAPTCDSAALIWRSFARRLSMGRARCSQTVFSTDCSLGRSSRPISRAAAASQLTIIFSLSCSNIQEGDCEMPRLVWHAIDHCLEACRRKLWLQ